MNTTCEHHQNTSPRQVRLAFVFLLCLAWLTPARGLAAEGWTTLVSPDNSLEFYLLKDRAPAGRLGLGGWGPNWQWVGLAAKDVTTETGLHATVPFVVNQAKGEVIGIGFEAAKTGPL